MLLKNVMWDIFQNTGQIEAYLMYRTCETDEKCGQTEQKDVLEESVQTFDN